MRLVVCLALTLTFALSLKSDTTYGLETADLQSQLDQVLDKDPTARRTTVALKVIDIESGEVLYDRFGDRLFTPASNLKIYTSACALDLFGPQHTFPTNITASVDSANKSIEGPLTIVGGGNAMFSSADLAALADRVVNEWKFKTLQGEVKVDNSRYNKTQLGPGWMWDDQQYYYNMPVTAMMLDFNTRKLPGVLDADGDPVRIALEDPAFWIASDFDKLLIERGVELGEESEDDSDSDDNFGDEGESDDTSHAVQRMISFPGPPLVETLKHFNHVSENAVGEVLLHEIAIEKGVQNSGWSEGAKHITRWLEKTAGLEPGSFKLVDGSGLSRYNLISADSSVQLLKFMHGHKHYESFYKALPAYEVELGVDDKQELVRAKPGGMSSVSTISGYLTTLDGRQLAFSLLANGYIGSARPVFALRQKVWSTLANYQATSE